MTVLCGGGGRCGVRLLPDSLAHVVSYDARRRPGLEGVCVDAPISRRYRASLATSDHRHRGSPLHQLTDTWDDLAAVQLDVGHEGLVGQAAGAVLQVEARGTQRAQVGGDLLGDGLGDPT